MSTTDTREHVSATECTQMRERFTDGEPSRAIATDLGWARSTVLRHIHGVCSHSAPDEDDGTDECIVDRPHLTQERPPGSRHRATHRQEAFCRGCKDRITITPDGLEVGHRHQHSSSKDRCEYRPAELDSS